MDLTVSNIVGNPGKIRAAGIGPCSRRPRTNEMISNMCLQRNYTGALRLQHRPLDTGRPGRAESSQCITPPPLHPHSQTHTRVRARAHTILPFKKTRRAVVGTDRLAESLWL